MEVKRYIIGEKNNKEVKMLFAANYNEIIDLTHEVHPGIPTWDLTCGYFVKTLRDYHHCEGEFKFRSQALNIRAGAGTHVDSPAHCFEGARDVSEIPLEQLIIPCVVIDVSGRRDERYKVSKIDIEAFENRYGKIKPGVFVIVNTGWAKYWENPKKYCNNHVFPSISKEAAEELLKRDIVGVGIDTLSPDCDEKGSFVHATLLGAGKLIIENIKAADQMPPMGATLLIMPLKVQGAAESPIRLIGIVPKV
jgi:kynurenine formamidase